MALDIQEVFDEWNSSITKVSHSIDGYAIQGV